MPVVPLVCVLRPTSDVELAVAIGLLEAYGVPFHVRNGGFGGMYPGLYSPLLNGRAVMVPESAAEDAKALLVDFQAPDPHLAG